MRVGFLKEKKITAARYNLRNTNASQVRPLMADSISAPTGFHAVFELNNRMYFLSSQIEAFTLYSRKITENKKHVKIDL